MFGLFKENLKIALGSIRTQLLRTTLTVLIIAIGITALVGILTVVSALENTISNDFASMGSNTFTLNQYANVTRNEGGEERDCSSRIRSITGYKGNSSVVFITLFSTWRDPVFDQRCRHFPESEKCHYFAHGNRADVACGKYEFHRIFALSWRRIRTDFCVFYSDCCGS